MPERRAPRWGCFLLFIILIVAVGVGWREYGRLVREEPERFPWTPLSLSDPIGPFTAAKLAALADDPQRCEALMTAHGDADRPAPSRRGPVAGCGYEDGIRLQPETERSIEFAPVNVVTACPVAAALALWEREVVQPAAMRFLGERVTRIDHLGSYSCRGLYGKRDGPLSEHATADAIDIAGFRLASGRALTIRGEWNKANRDAAFLHALRDGACDLFVTVLSPDYNVAHGDHLHLDQAQRGRGGWRACK